MSDATPPCAYETPEIRPHDPRLRPAAEAERARLAGDREAYTAAKAAFVANALAGPGASAGHRRTEPLK